MECNHSKYMHQTATSFLTAQPPTVLYSHFKPYGTFLPKLLCWHWTILQLKIQMTHKKSFKYSIPWVSDTRALHLIQFCTSRGWMKYQCRCFYLLSTKGTHSLLTFKNTLKNHLLSRKLCYLANGEVDAWTCKKNNINILRNYWCELKSST